MICGHCGKEIERRTASGTHQTVEYYVSAYDFSVFCPHSAQTGAHEPVEPEEEVNETHNTNNH